MKIFPIQTGCVWVKEAQRKGVGTGFAGKVRGFLPEHWPELFNPTPVWQLAESESWETFPDTVPITGDGAVRILELGARRPTVYLPSRDRESRARLEKAQTLEVMQNVAV